MKRMFNVVRFIAGCVLLCCAIAIIKKSNNLHKRLLCLIFVGISIAFVTILAFLPFENLFITFDSPNDAYEYYSFGKSNIQLVLEGNDSDFVVDCKNDTDAYLIIPKTVNGWKIGIGTDTKRIIQKFSNGIVIYVYQYKNTNDYYITILDTTGGETYVCDDYNTNFYSLERINSSLGKTFVTYYAHISCFNSKYSVIVNGDKIVLGNESTQGDE